MRSKPVSPIWPVLFVMGLLVPTTAPAAAAQSDHGQSITAMYLDDLERLESKFIELAEAMETDMYAWRPMEGVRSVSEVYMLIVAENYVVPSAWDAAPPPGMTVDNSLFQTMPEVTEKSRVVEHLRKSFAYYKDVVANLSQEQLHATIRFFGQERSVNEAIFLITTDMHEHLGQAIAYARMNKVVPPWTARQQMEQ